MTLDRRLEGPEEAALEAEATRFGAFLGLPVELTTLMVRR